MSPHLRSFPRQRKIFDNLLPWTGSTRKMGPLGRLTVSGNGKAAEAATQSLPKIILCALCGPQRLRVNNPPPHRRMALVNRDSRRGSTPMERRSAEIRGAPERDSGVPIGVTAVKL